MTGAAVGRGGPGQAARGQLRAARPVLRNPVFARRSARHGATAAPATPTFRGRFARSRWAQEEREGNEREHHHHHRFGFVLGFVGPMFWPYAYDDFVDYTFWPYGYDTFWPYAFDDLYAGIYGAYAPEYYAPEDAYLYAGAPATGTAYAYGGPSPVGQTAATGGTSRICAGQPTGFVDFPIDRIARQVQPDQKQQALLDALKAATARAVDILQAACPNELPSTPTGRLAAMRTRVGAMLKAVQVVLPALDGFYQSLDGDQRERFNALDQDLQPTQRQRADLARVCGKRAGRPEPGLPIARIERALRLRADQEAALKNLEDASAKARDILSASCQPDQTLTPTGRLTAMQARLDAMLHALDTVQPQLTRFYGSLSDEQKARFDRLGGRPV